MPIFIVVLWAIGLTPCFVHYRSIVDERFPRVGQALEDSGTPLAAVSASWFLTLYVNQLPWEVRVNSLLPVPKYPITTQIHPNADQMLTKYTAQCCLRVWDVLLFERTRRILFQAALALIDVNAKRMVEVSLCLFPYGQLDTNVMFCLFTGAEVGPAHGTRHADGTRAVRRQRVAHGRHRSIHRRDVG